MKETNDNNQNNLDVKRKPFTIRYNPPENLEEAYKRKEELGAAILQIQSQLGSKQEDNEWRKKTKIALLCKTEELRRIKNYIREQKEIRFDSLKEALEVLKHLETCGIDITERGRSILQRFNTLH